MDECEASFESALTWKLCSKNPGHPSFIPAHYLCVKHLPEWAQHEAVLEYLKNIMARTVRLRVALTSSSRPQSYKASGALHTGSGWVHWVSPGEGKCPCADCDQNLSSAQSWWKVAVETACHVVFDTEEARSTRVDVFYDDEASLQNGTARTMCGIDMYDRSEEFDRSWFWCATHDPRLVDQLQWHLGQRWTLKKLLLQCHHDLSSSKHDFCVIVSHPHGQPKQVTVGELRQSSQLDEKDHSSFIWTYSTDTCAGSSGAPVIVARQVQSADGPLECTIGLAPHSKGGVDGNENQSGVGSLTWY
ncbi:hypothetical protein PoB_002208900 [Plakobranchus ocellatus]|uniref:Uncharacterized protein n=1 Tax=Plakobranchus ocellatus TaxID=259542 RepID=A0AAV3ZMH4_9GAST|nr:hypothetical protein PoB_002208900 [Plakobranchus ocellatus]